jgi:hypothetical protein
MSYIWPMAPAIAASHWQAMGEKFLLDTFYGMIKLGNGKRVYPKM